MTSTPHSPHAAPWKITTALALVYLSWGTTYFAIKEGVKTLPPFAFGGARIGLAGFVLLLGLFICRQPLRISGRDLLWSWFLGLLLFVGGNGLINIAEKTVDSGLASVLVATTPLWLALLETVWPWGERLTWRGWIGMLAGLLGVMFLALPKMGHSEQATYELSGCLIVLASAFTWAVGTFGQRYRRTRAPALVAAAYQMMIGGACMVLLGVALGEPQRIGVESITPGAVWAFCHLLVVGSLIGYVAYVWLLGHVSTTVAGTYAYVNPVVALAVGQLAGEDNFQWPVVTGMLVILTGVALVRRGGGTHRHEPTKQLREVGPSRSSQWPTWKGTCSQSEKC